MSREAVMIEDRLHSAGYKTQRVGSEVEVFDPVYRSMPVVGLIPDGYKMVEIRTIQEAWKFIEARK